MKIVGFCNLKGGVGKTTMCQNLAAALASLGRRIAVLDLDPQSNLSSGWGITVDEGEPYVYDFLVGDSSLQDLAVRREGVDVIPSSLDLAVAELQLEREPGRDSLLKAALEGVDEDSYDYIFCDSPPQLGLFTRNVLAAADEIMVPLESEFYSLAGVRLLDSTVKLFKKRLNKDLAVGGVVLTRHNPKVVINRDVQREVASYYGDVLFRRYVRQNVSIVEASGAGMSVLSYDKNCNGAKDYRLLAEEFEERQGRYGKEKTQSA
ncbi:MAG: ParA family protein [Synergistales bacterium]|nr:ParA family protein [Synergistales bacterium]